MLLLLVILIMGLTESVAYAHTNSEHKIVEQGHITASENHEGHANEHKETPPETFAVLDLFSEALEASIAGVGVKVSELKPKVEHIQELYRNGEKHKAFAKGLGVSTEVVLIGFFIEAFGVGELFISALSLSGNWVTQLAQSLGGIVVSSKVATIAGEKVEEAAEEKYKHAIHSQSKKTAILSHY